MAVDNKKHAAMETIVKFYPTEPDTTAKKAVKKFEPATYYAEDARQTMLELSDERVLWKVNIADNIQECEYYIECSNSLANLSKHYHTKFGGFGRSGRHICVPDTPANRRNYRHMVKAVEREQERIIEMFKGGMHHDTD